jgi:hypothetical protein
LDNALRLGFRGLEGGSSLARLLAEHRHVRNPSELPGLSRQQILAWADAHQKRTGAWPTARTALTAAQVVGWAKAHHRRTGDWPTRESGAIGSVLSETWHGVDLALRWGYRGLPGGSSLGRLLRVYRE